MQPQSMSADDVERAARDAWNKSESCLCAEESQIQTSAQATSIPLKWIGLGVLALWLVM